MTCTKERFERDVAQHQMTIVRDDGVDRHIKFRAADDNFAYWFDIVTWNNVLIIRGDCGTYVFSRLEDMFQFFRSERYGAGSEKLYINDSYWCEKLQAVSNDGYGRGSAQGFSAESFERHVKQRVDDYFETRAITDARRTSLWHEIERDVLDYVSDGDRSSAFMLLDRFHDREFPHLFDECYEWHCEEFDFHFIWNLYAIVWAIRQYDAARATTEAE